MNTFSIKYQTAEVVPPPFSHAIEIHGEIALNQELKISFELTYLDRNNLTLEEIEEEGFTENDDFSWQGTLPKVWSDVILGNLKTSKSLIINELNEIQDFWEIQNENKTFYPKNTEDWKYLLEELQQAIYEKAEKEAPMKLTFLKISSQEKIQAEMVASFENREIKLTISTKKQVDFLAWDELNYILKNVFSAEFYPENAETKMPNKNGVFLNTGDEFWYEFGKSVKGNARKIEQLFIV